MVNKKNKHITYPSSEKIYIAGGINKVYVGMRKIKLTDTITTDEKGEKSIKKNNSVVLYDTSGPFSDPKITIDENKGLPRIREEWCNRRKDVVRLKKCTSEYARNRQSDKTATNSHFPIIHLPYKAKEGKNISQMYYAKKRIITPEMEYVAIRENQQIEALGLKSYITPDFIRKEIAAGRAIIPANINHPESEPMIIGKKFLVKINTKINNQAVSTETKELAETIIWHCKWGSDTLMDTSRSGNIYETHDWLLRNSPIPVGSIPLYQALAKVNHKIEDLDWPIYQETLIEQAEQGIDFFVIHAGLVKKHIDMSLSRLTGIVSTGGNIMATWMQIHKKENFLYTHFHDICKIMKTYDVTLSLGNSLRPGSIYDSNDRAFFAELQNKGALTQIAREDFVQVMVEGSGHIPMNKLQENVKEQQYSCQNVPYFCSGPASTDVAPGYDHMASSIGAAQIAWQGAGLLGAVTPVENQETPSKEDIRNSIIAYKIAAHAADLAKGHPGAQARDNALSKACVENRIKDQLNLALDPERAAYYYKNRLKKTR